MKYYLHIANPGIHRTEASTSTRTSRTAQIGQGFFTVSPSELTQASYPEPSIASSANEDMRMESIASGDRYFQHIIQYIPGRWPVISSMSSANLKI